MGYQQLWLSYNQLFNLFFFLILCQVTCLHTQLCSQEQNSALLQLKGTFSLNKSASWYCDYYENTSFPKTESWKRGSDCCSWDGVDCDGETGQVIGLDLSCSWLKGTIHPNSSLFLSFPHLQKLNLAHNHFLISHISPEFTRFTELTHLNLSGCGFSGKVPLGISFLNKLLSLDLSQNYGLRLEKGGFESLIQNLSKIRDLDLLGVNMSSLVVPNSMLNLTSLRTLSLGGSGLCGEFPSGIFHLPHLQKLELEGDADEALTGYLPDFMNLSYPLQYLILTDTGFSGIMPDSIANLKSLEELTLESNGFHGSIPTSFWNLTQITCLWLLGNNFNGILPSSISNLRNLEVLTLSNNNFSGILPSSISNLRNLEVLQLSHNNFNGILPSSISNLRNLEVLYLSYNNFSGILLSSISNLRNLSFLGLSGNNFSGFLPSSISNLTKLQRLYLSDNNFTGPFFSWDTNLTKLEFLDVSNNCLVGPFFSWDTNLTKLKILDVSNNCLVGPLPSQGIVAPNLLSLNIGQNLINGTIPSWVFKLPVLVSLNLSHNKLIGHTLEFQSTSLEMIDLSNNNLHGTVPNSTFELPNLSLLILSSNTFSGTIPESNRLSKHLTVLELQRNNFSGIIHDSFKRENSLDTINLNSNGFEGPIPKSLVHCRQLEVLDLGNNKFLDKFPHWLEHLPKLHILILRSNIFHGPMVTFKTKFPFPSLRVIDMSDNKLTGPLPEEYFRNFQAMENVDERNLGLQYMDGGGNYYSLTMVIKGSFLEMEKVLTYFIAIDLSRNQFEGKIPDIVGRLNSVRGLNLSYNKLTGQIPTSLGNLTELEWLDLSSNKLTGEIPQHLENLKWLEVLNLSHNQLTGSIPRGKQFDSFSNDSYLDNLALCGSPLSNKCSDSGLHEPPPSMFQQGEDSQYSRGFDWEVILPGYGFGLVFGLVLGYLMFSFGKPQWLVTMIEGMGKRTGERVRRHVRRNRGKTN